jgi:hypothetical protein
MGDKMSKEFEPTDGQKEVLEAVNNLVRIACRNKIVVAGFTFGVVPAFVSSFGNTSDNLDPRMYKALLEMVKKKKEKGDAISMPIREIN